MSIVRHLQNVRQFEARRRPCLELVSVSMRNLLAEIRQELFPEITHSIAIKFVDSGPLACIWHDDSLAEICIHQLLNHYDTPREVLSMIVKHELLHLRIPPVVVQGREIQHHPEFVAAQASICPELDATWCWLSANFADCLIVRRQREGIDVRSKWKTAWGRRRLDLTESCELLGRAPAAVPGLQCGIL